MHCINYRWVRCCVVVTCAIFPHILYQETALLCCGGLCYFSHTPCIRKQRCCVVVVCAIFPHTLYQERALLCCGGLCYFPTHLVSGDNVAVSWWSVLFSHTPCIRRQHCCVVVTCAIFPHTLYQETALLCRGDLCYFSTHLVSGDSVAVSWWSVLYNHRPRAGNTVSRFGLEVKRWAGKQKDLGSIRFGSPFSSKIVVYGHSLVTLLTQLMKH